MKAETAMLTYLKNIFRKTPAVPLSAPRVIARAAESPALPRVETASLQLAAIIDKLPEDLRQLVVKQPPPEAMVALPLPTILKYLPSGSVKMSLASVVRQSPPGTFGAVNTQDKRMVEVPLGEIFKRVSPAILKKRDQKFTGLAEDGIDIFGDEENPHALAPRVVETPPARMRATVPASAPRSLQMRDTDLLQPPAPLAAPRVAAAGASSESVPMSLVGADSTGDAIDIPDPFEPTATDAMFKRVPPASAKPPRAIHPPSDLTQPPPSPPTPQRAGQGASSGEEALLQLSLKELAAFWPEPIKSEVAALNGATVAFPARDVAAGLSQGKVAFQWGQIRAWMTPPPQQPTAASEATELQLPLRIVAPAFLKLTKREDQKKKAALDESIPALFAGQNSPAVEALPEPAEPIVPAAPEFVEAAEPIQEPLAEAPEITPEAETPPTPVIEFKFADDNSTEEPASLEPSHSTHEVLEVTSEEVTVESTLEGSVVPAAANGTTLPQTLGEVFGQPEKTSWSPNEIVANLIKLPTVGGAIIALQEGLVVAHHLPDGMKGEVFAAFLPQIFARLNQYANEMKLGAIDDLVLNAAGKQCQLFRMGEVYFAAVAKPDQSLPWHELRLCAQSLAES